jgi:hypothetical protein
MEIRVWQVCEDGIDIFGHGIIQQTVEGGISVELVCKEERIPQSVSDLRRDCYNLPKNPINAEERIFAEFIGVDGREFVTEDFALNLSGFSSIPVNNVILFYVPFLKWKFEPENPSDYLYIEFFEYADIPKNKRNTIEYSDGGYSDNRNEADINYENFSVIIKSEDEYTSVVVTGDFDQEEMLDSIIFYVGFSCGVQPQPFLICEHDHKCSSYTIRAINKDLVHLKSSNPIPPYFIGKGGFEENYSYDLFLSIYKFRKEKTVEFKSLYEHWYRIWHGIRSISAVSELVISVSVEGLIRDLFIPKLNEYDLITKKDFQVVIDTLKSTCIASDSKSRLISSIGYWNQITPEKVLKFLEEQEIISKLEKNSWSKLRNKVAHPNILNSGTAMDTDRLDRITTCLDLFHKLVLNVLAYSGPIHYFGNGKSEGRCQIIEYKNVLTK